MTRRYRGVLHAYSGDLALAEEAYGWNFVLSLGGPVTFTNARTLHQLVPRLRLDRLMLETDAPYLAPVPYRGKRNECGYILYVAQKLAELKAVAVNEIDSITTDNASKLFRL